MINPVSLLTGLGHLIPVIAGYTGLSSFLDEDVFFLSFISRYGIAIPLLLIFTLSFTL
jgi:hypothetical protein